jgi:hypothetical protein
LEGGALAQIEGRHRAGGGNALRAAVLGANDGLVSNMSLVMGVAGAALSGSVILVTGLAGLLAGAFSMALGEWLSVQSSRELYERQIAIEKEEIIANPAEEAEELALIYQARGLEEAESRVLAKRILADEGSALETLSREELGIDPSELGGSAWEAAITSFILCTSRRYACYRRQPVLEHPRLICHWRRNHTFYGSQRSFLRCPPGAVWPCRRCNHLSHWAFDRREHSWVDIAAPTDSDDHPDFRNFRKEWLYDCPNIYGR